jgi:hypothetical protein
LSSGDDVPRDITQFDMAHWYPFFVANLDD